jgi:hypothetical protein
MPSQGQRLTSGLRPQLPKNALDFLAHLQPQLHEIIPLP